MHWIRSHLTGPAGQHLHFRIRASEFPVCNSGLQKWGFIHGPSSRQFFRPLRIKLTHFRNRGTPVEIWLQSAARIASMDRS